MNNQSALDNYFLELKSILDVNNLGGKPGQIYNMDDTGIPLDHHSPRVLQGRRKLFYTGRAIKYAKTYVKAEVDILCKAC